MDSLSGRIGTHGGYSSKVGIQLAQSAVRAAGEAHSPIVADRFLEETLRSICDSSQTTEHEKALARMGLAMGEGPELTWQNSTRALQVVAGAIASSVAGPLGSVLAQVALQACDQADRWSHADHFAAEGLNAVRENPEASELEKSVATLGLRMGGKDGAIPEVSKFEKAMEKAVDTLLLRMGGQDGPTHQSKSQAQLAALRVLAATGQGPASQVLAQVALKAYQQADRWSDADRFVGEGLQAVARGPEVTSVHREMSLNALKATSQGVSPRDSAHTRAQVLREVIRQ